MQEQKALELGSAWWAANAGAGGTNKPVGLRDYLALELHKVLPEPHLHGVAQFEGEPWLLLLCGDALVLAAASIDVQGVPTADLRVVPLMPRPTITIKATPSPDHASRIRTWCLKTPTDEPLEIATSEVIRAAFPSDARPDAGEVVMRRLLADLTGEAARGPE